LTENDLAKNNLLGKTCSSCYYFYKTKTHCVKNELFHKKVDATYSCKRWFQRYTSKLDMSDIKELLKKLADASELPKVQNAKDE